MFMNHTEKKELIMFEGPSQLTIKTSYQDKVNLHQSFYNFFYTIAIKIEYIYIYIYNLTKNFQNHRTKTP